MKTEQEAARPILVNVATLAFPGGYQHGGQFGWCLVAEFVTGPVAELVLDGEQVFGRVDAEVGAFGKAVAERALAFVFEPRCQGEWESRK